jgi:hypothetical protein
MNRRELLRDVGVAAAAASPLLASGAGRAQDRTAQTNVLIAYHSVSGNTEKMAQGVAEGREGCPWHQRRFKTGGRGGRR